MCCVTIRAVVLDVISVIFQQKVENVYECLNSSVKHNKLTDDCTVVSTSVESKVAGVSGF